MNDEVRFYNDVKIQKKESLIAIVGLAFVWFTIFLIDFIPYQIAAGYMEIFFLVKFSEDYINYRKKKPQLIVNRQGIIDNSNSPGFGMIKWSEIRHMEFQLTKGTIIRAVWIYLKPGCNGKHPKLKRLISRFPFTYFLNRRYVLKNEITLLYFADLEHQKEMYRCVLKYYNQYRISVGEEEIPYEIVDIDKQNEIETQQKKERKKQMMEKHGRKIIILVSVVAILTVMYAIWNVIQNPEKYEADKMIPVMLVCCLVAALCFLLIGLLYNKGAEIRNILIAVMLLGVTIVLLVFDTVGRLGQEGTPIITDTMEYVLVWAVVLGCVIYIIRSSIVRKKT
jgi:hypothetical protein